jgi:hypothetical protein
MRSTDYGDDALAGEWRPRRVVRELPAAIGEVVEDAATGFTGEIVAVERDVVTLLGRGDRRRTLPLLPGGFLVDGEPVTLVRVPVAATAVRRTASGSIAGPAARARVALPSRIYVEGKHDAELVEKVWGDDLRGDGVVVEPLHGIDDLAGVVHDFDPAPGRRLGVLVDHLVPRAKESRIVADVRHPHVLVVGHPYVDVWQAVKPAAIGITAWPVIPPGQDWRRRCSARSSG